MALIVLLKRGITVPFLILLCVTGAILFAKGFLGVRTLIADKNQLINPINNPPSKVVVIVIDALRTDFVLPSLNPDKQSEAWWNKLKVLNELALKDKLNVKLFHFVADPPTATTPRLTGITAGSLPAFIQLAQNFAEDSLGGDSIVHQLLHHPKYNNLAVLGDDTWLSLFPEIKEKSKGVIAGYHSFHLFDLTSVDNGIKSHLFPLLSDESKYEAIIAHFLGVDHCGHKYGPTLAPCGEKLSEMDTVLRDVIEKLPQNSLLFVLGDHGMTDEGDHGGNSQREISSVLFSYRKTSNFSTEQSIDQNYWNKVMSNVAKCRLKYFPELQDQFYFEEVTNSSSITSSISQVDFASTFSLLLGIPIPFGNVGCFIPEIFVDYSLYSKHEVEEARKLNWELLIKAARSNALQIRNFLDKSGSLGDSGFSSYSLSKVNELYFKATNEDSMRSSEDEFYDILEFLQCAQQHCRKVWSSFNYYLIFSGLGIMTLSLILLTIALVYTLQGTILSFASFSLPIIHSLTLFSTSFIGFEDWLTKFFLMTLLTLTLDWRYITSNVLLIIVIRLSSLFGGCREEQYPWCQLISHRSFTASINSFSTLLITLISFIPSLDILTWASRRENFSLLWILGITLLIIRCHLAWWIDTRSIIDSSLLDAVDIKLPRILYVIFGFLTWNCRKTVVLSFAVTCLTAITLRPFAAFVQLIVGYHFMRLINFSSGYKSPAFLGIVHYLFGMQLFFITGHQLNFTNLQWEAAFVGLRSTIQSVAAILMIMNTFSGPIIAACLVPMCASVYFIYYSLALLATSMLSTGILMRHMMVWRMLTPRFLLQAAISLIIISIIITRKCLLTCKHL